MISNIFLDIPVATTVDDEITEEQIEARRARRLIHFASDGEVKPPGGLSRIPTPYPKELRALAKHTKNIRTMKKEREKGVMPLLAGETIPTSSEVKFIYIFLKFR